MKLSGVIFCAALLATATNAQAQLPVDGAAPGFSMTVAQAGKEFGFSLADAVQSGPIVLYFYPKSFTKVCTEEAHAFADASEKFKEMKATILGVSADTIDTQREFSTKECRDKFMVGADPGLAVIKSYDAADPGGKHARRISYVIATDQKILSVTESDSPDKHVKNALTAIRTWRETHPVK